MDVVGIPLWLYLLTVVMGLIVYYMWYMSMDLNVFERMRVDGPSPMPILGNLGHILTSGLYQSQLEMYRKYKDRKVFGIFDSRTPCLVVTDLNLIKHILIDHFNTFPDRQRYIHGDSILHHSLPFLQGNQWRRVSSCVTSTLNDPDNLRKISFRFEKRKQAMIEYLNELIEEEDDVELMELFNHFNVDSILSTCYGLKANSFQNREYSFTTNVRKIRFTLWLSKIVHFFCPFLGGVCRYLGICSCEKSVTFFDKLTELTLSKAKEKKNRTLLQILFKENLLRQANNEMATSPHNMAKESQMVTASERNMKGQAFSLTLSSYNTVPSVMSYTMFMLANNPECCQRIQEEIDAIVESESRLNYDNVRHLTYLDMCINESMRMFPIPVNIDRVCVEDVTIEGFKFPKGMPVFFPIHAIHNDPDIWPDPEEFRPERFSVKSKAKQLPFSFLPFGDGPRKCVGKELSLLQMKIGIASILKYMTPSPCYNTVYPVKLSRFSNSASDGLWVKMELRRETTLQIQNQ